MRKQVYSDGKSRNLDLGFEIPINNDVKISDVEGNTVPFILAKRNKIRFTKGIPVGDLFVDFEESLPAVRPVPLDNMGLALIKQKDIDRLNIFAQELGLKEAIINKKELDIQALGEAIKSLETDNAQRIDENLISANQAFQEVYAYINKVNDDANANLTYNTDFVLGKVNEVLLALQAHQEAQNPHKITKETVGLSLVDNTADIDKPVSKAVQEALNQKLDVAEADKIRGEIKKSEKKFEKLSSGIMNMTGGLAQLELPRGGKAGQALIKASNKDGDFIWGSGAIPEHNETLYRDAANAHPISSITGLTSALDAKANIADLAVIATSGDYNDLINKPSIPTKTSDLNNDSGFITKDVNNLTNYTTTTDLNSLLADKQDTISDLNTIRSDASAGKNASDTIATYGDVVTYNASDFATAAQGSLADTAVQPGDLATVATSGDYDDLVDKPTIGDGTITLTQGGVSKGTFTTNQSGNTTIDFDAITIDQTYDATSANAQSGVAINGAKFTQNIATGTGALTINGTAATAQYAVNLGTSSSAGNSAVAVGYNTAANGARSISLGYNARIGASTADAIQIGYGTNSTACSFYVGFYNNSTTHYNWQLLDGITGYIPGERLNLKTVNGTSLLGSGDVTVDSLPSQTGQSGKFLTTDGTDASWASVGQGMPIGTIYALSCSASYVPEGSLPLDGTQYTKAQFTDLWNNYLTGNDPLLLTCSYADYASDIATYGQCVKWAVDTVNETFKVPTIKDGSFIQQALSDSELGKCYKAGLPNITGSITNTFAYSDTVFSGAFSSSTFSYNSLAGGSACKFITENFDASDSSPVYGNSTTVQPEAVALRYFVVVANGEINESMMDWAAWASSLAGKANVSSLAGKLNTDGSNAAQGSFEAIVNQAQATGKASVVSWGIPDYTAGTTITVSTSGYNVSKDSYVVVSGSVSSMKTLILQIGSDVVDKAKCATSSSGTYHCRGFIPAGSVIKVYVDTTVTSATGVIYPLKGVS